MCQGRLNRSCPHRLRRPGRLAYPRPRVQEEQHNHHQQHQHHQTTTTSPHRQDGKTKTHAPPRQPGQPDQPSAAGTIAHMSHVALPYFCHMSLHCRTEKARGGGRHRSQRMRMKQRELRGMHSGRIQGVLKGEIEEDRVWVAETPRGGRSIATATRGSSF